MTRLPKLLMLLLAMLALAAPQHSLSAQATTAELAGTVQDASGAAIPRAVITAVNVDTNVARTTRSEGNGEYVLTQLPPGTYNVTVEAPGFSKLVQNRIELRLNQQSRLPFTLAIGQATETVEVNARPPILESESSSIGTVVDQKLVNQLPLNGRNFTQLATLSPGVTGVGQSATGTIQSGTRPDDRRPPAEIFSNGNREGDNNFLFDGVDDNERLTLSIVVRPNVEDVREFKIQTNLYSADVGRNSGAVIDVVSKSGTNQLHGSAFEYIRNSYVDARSYFNRVGTPFPAFRLNQYGGSFGAPLTVPHLYSGRDRTFLFFDYEGTRNTTQNFLLGTVPTLRMRNGDFGETATIYDPATTVANPASSTGYSRTAFANNFIPVSRRDPIAVKMINAYPVPTSSGRVNNYSTNVLSVNNADSGDVRVDEQITQKALAFARYSIQNSTSLVPSTYPRTTIPGISTPVDLSDEASFAGTDSSPTQHVAIGYTRIATAHLASDFRVGFNRYRIDYLPAGYTPGGALGNQLGVPKSNVTPREQNLPIFSPANYLGIGQTRSLPILRRENTFQELDNVTWTLGRHTLKFGGDFRRRQLTIYQTNMGNGRFNFSAALTDSRNSAGGGGDSAASFLLGAPTLIGHDYTFPFPGMRVNEVGVYFADDWRAIDKLTLNYGLRWDYFSPPSEAHNQFANFNLATGKLDVSGRNGVGNTVGVQPFRKNFGPRLGFAYQAQKTLVIRGGFGLFYNASGSESINMRLFRNIPFGLTISNSPGDIFTTQTISQGFPAAPVLNLNNADTPSGVQYAVDHSFRPGYAEQFNLGIEQEITPLDMVFKLAGVGNLGRALYLPYNANQAVPGATALATRRPLYGINPNLSDVNLATSTGLADYYALQATVDKRLRQGVNLLAGYTWSHAIDDVPLEFGGGASGATPQDPRNSRAERSNSIIDQRQRLTLSYLWILPFGKGQKSLSSGPASYLLGGWQTNGILFTQTGLYFSPVLATSTTNTGTGSRPNQIGPITYPHTLQQWFNPAVYASPAAYTYGTAGRNSLIGPGRTNFDVSLLKTVPIYERLAFQLRFEAFNVFNHPQFGYPNPNIGNAAVGTITSVVGTPRNLQLSGRIEF